MRVLSLLSVAMLGLGLLLGTGALLGLVVLPGMNALPQVSSDSADQSAMSSGGTTCPYGITTTQVTPNLIHDMNNLTGNLKGCWVRLQINAKSIGPDSSPHWQTLDTAIHALHAAGIRIDAVLRCFGGNNCFQNPPVLPSQQQIESFASAVANRYGKEIDSYEILNEEYDNVARSQLPNYCSLLSAGYTTIKKINPNATVGTYGTYKMNATHLNAVIQALKSCSSSMDYVNIHYYAGGGDPAGPGKGFLSFQQAITMLKNALNKPIWVTETGWPISNPKIVTYMKEELDEARTSGIVTHVFWYTLDFPQQNPHQPDDIHYSQTALNTLQHYIAQYPDWPSQSSQSPQ